MGLSDTPYDCAVDHDQTLEGLVVTSAFLERRIYWWDSGTKTLEGAHLTRSGK